MSMRIPPSPPLPIPSRSTPRLGAGDADSAPYGNLIREFEEGAAGPTDFLGEQRRTPAGARTFNADGFFSKLEQHLAELPTKLPAAAEAPSSSLHQEADPSSDRDRGTATVGPRQDHLPASAQKPERHVPHLPNAASERAHAVQAARAAGEPIASAGKAETVGYEDLGRSEHASQPPVRLGLGATPFRAFIDGGSVRIIGPARYLTDMEEEALAAAVADLMATHDLGVEDLWFNGRRMMPDQGVAG